MSETKSFLSVEQGRNVAMLMSAEDAYQDVHRTAHPEIATQFWNQIKHRMMEETGMGTEEFDMLAWNAWAFRYEINQMEQEL